MPDLLQEISGLTNQEGVVLLPPHMVTRTVLGELLAAIFDNYDARAIWLQTSDPVQVDAALRAGFAIGAWNTEGDTGPVLVMTPLRFKRPVDLTA